MLSSLLLIFVGFLLLVSGAYFLVRGATSIARRYNLSAAIIGLTVVGFGTSTPELVVTIYSALRGRDELAFATVLGSNIFNVLFVLGIAGIISPLIVQRNTVRFEIPLSLIAITLLYIFVNDHVVTGAVVNQLSRYDAIFLLVIFAGLLVYMSRSLQTANDLTEPTATAQTRQGATASILLGLAFLVGGGILVVDYAVVVSAHYDLPLKRVGLLLVAIGCSLPELTTAVIAAEKRNTDLAIGNVIGSTLFNVLFALPVAAAVSPVEYNTSLNVDMEVLGVSTIALIVFMFTVSQRKLTRGAAIILICCYFVYLVFRLQTT